MKSKSLDRTPDYFSNPSSTINDKGKTTGFRSSKSLGKTKITTFVRDMKF